MIGFVEWIERNPFYVRDWFDFSEVNPKLGWKQAGPLVLSDFQKRILHAALDPNEDGLLPYETVIYSTIKKSGKTALAAAITMWYAQEVAPEGSEIYMMANNEEQAKARAFNDLLYHVETRNTIASNAGERKWKVTMDRISLENGTFIKAVPNNYTASAGSRHVLTVWDELWGFNTELARRLWEEMTPIPTVRNGLRLVVSYAGILGESDLLWDLYLSTVGEEEHQDGMGKPVQGLENLPCWKNGSIFTYWDHVPRMPWQTPAYYQQQRDTLRPSAYLRLHENRWVTSAETFIPSEWWDQCIVPEHVPLFLQPDSPFRHHPIVIGVDAAPKHDSSAVVAVTYDNKLAKTVLLSHKIWTPEEGVDFDLDDTVAAWVLDMHRRYHVTQVLYDPTQLHQPMMNLKKRGVKVEEIPQRGDPMLVASQSLYDTLRYRRLVAYPAEDLRSHVQNAVAVEESRGFRITKPSGRDKYAGTRKVDGCVALAIAIYAAINNMQVQTEDTIIIESAFSDTAIWQTIDPIEMRMPWQLRR